MSEGGKCNTPEIEACRPEIARARERERGSEKERASE